ncbi:hypothetical protein STCU_05092 [Strigomonas culicis]|uniref:Uncharacterized protein n=1 Tax=Strigomonas culicis TaxID=28005 RepID=S9UHT8_9TRYP|nr:hypothetical protein STCU_05092 [Strigomonas culicis]|eukprot:EPY28488.1 hypothetical protein STCU_05092 [Strigomonas culicis]
MRPSAPSTRAWSSTGRASSRGTWWTRCGSPRRSGCGRWTTPTRCCAARRRRRRSGSAKRRRWRTSTAWTTSGSPAWTTSRAAAGGATSAGCTTRRGRRARCRRSAAWATGSASSAAPSTATSAAAAPTACRRSRSTSGSARCPRRTRCSPRPMRRPLRRCATSSGTTPAWPRTRSNTGSCASRAPRPRSTWRSAGPRTGFAFCEGRLPPRSKHAARPSGTTPTPTCPPPRKCPRTTTTAVRRGGESGCAWRPRCPPARRPPPPRPFLRKQSSSAVSAIRLRRTSSAIWVRSSTVSGAPTAVK